MKGWGSYIKQQITTCSPSLYLLYSVFFHGKSRFGKLTLLSFEIVTLLLHAGIQDAGAVQGLYQFKKGDERLFYL